jgi:hypothetical protein
LAGVADMISRVRTWQQTYLTLKRKKGKIALVCINNYLLYAVFNENTGITLLIITF